MIMPFYSGNTEFNNQNVFPPQMIGLYPPQYMIPYPFMDGGYMMPNYQYGYPYFNQNGQLLYNYHSNNSENATNVSNNIKK